MAVTVKVGAIGAVPVEIGESESIGLGIGDKVYIKGDPGEPGFSPVITITELNHAHEVTITDEQGTQSFTVFDGEGVGIENAELNEDYTLTLYYTDGTSYTTPPIRGEQGETGPAGETGSDGTTFTPSVSSAGILSWTNDGGKTNPDPVNIKGPQGEQGSAGETGPAGPGVPAGGSTGQVLAKASGTDYDAEWISATYEKKTYTKASGNLPITTVSVPVSKNGIYAVSLAAQCETSGGNVAVVFQQGASTIFELYDEFDYNWKRVQAVDFMRLEAGTVNLTVTRQPTDLNEVVLTLAYLGA